MFAPAMTARPKTLASLCLAGALTVAAAGHAHAGVLAYVPNQGNGTASVIDTATQTQTALIPGMGTTYSAAVAPNGSIAYVADFSGSRIFPINTATNTAGTAIAVGSNPVNVTFSASSATAYVSNYSANSISVLNVASGTVSSTVAGVCPAGLPIQSVFHGTNLLIVCNAGTSVVRRMDTANANALSTLATLGNSAYNIAISTAAGFGYATNYGGASVTKFDLLTGAATTYPTTGVSSPLGLGVTPDGSKIYIGDYSSSKLIVMNPGGVISSTLNLGASIAGVGMSSNGSVLYAPLKGLAAGIKVINVASDTVTATIANPGANPQVIWGDFLGNVAAPAAVSVAEQVVDPFPKLAGQPFIPGISGQPTVLDLSKGSGPVIPDCLIATLKQTLGGEPVYKGQNASGATQIAWNGQLISFYPLAASTGRAQSEGIHFKGSNALDIVTGCGTLTTAPAINSLNELGAILNTMGLAAQLNAHGVATVLFNSAYYVVRPDYLVTLGAPATAGLVFGADGVLRLTDSEGRTQVLHPAFLDTDGLSAQLGSTLGGWVAIQDDGTALFTRLNGELSVLTPDLTLSAVPAANSAMYWWQDGPNHFMFRSSTLSLAQGYTARPRQ